MSVSLVDASGAAFLSPDDAPRPRAPRRPLCVLLRVGLRGVEPRERNYFSRGGGESAKLRTLATAEAASSLFCALCAISRNSFRTTSLEEPRPRGLYFLCMLRGLFSLLLLLLLLLRGHRFRAPRTVRLHARQGARCWLERRCDDQDRVPHRLFRAVPNDRALSPSLPAIRDRARGFSVNVPGLGEWWRERMIPVYCLMIWYLERFSQPASGSENRAFICP